MYVYMFIGGMLDSPCLLGGKWTPHDKNTQSFVIPVGEIFFVYSYIVVTQYPYTFYGGHTISKKPKTATYM